MADELILPDLEGNLLMVYGALYALNEDVANGYNPSLKTREWMAAANELDFDNVLSYCI